LARGRSKGTLSDIRSELRGLGAKDVRCWPFGAADSRRAMAATRSSERLGARLRPNLLNDAPVAVAIAAIEREIVAAQMVCPLVRRPAALHRLCACSSAR
jgi:hypothetical protein